MNQSAWVPAFRAHLRAKQLERRVRMAWVRGCITTAVIMLGLFVFAIASAQVPREAHDWKRTIIAEGRAQWGLAAPTAMFAAQIHQESAWNPQARSRVGALGMAQFMPATAKWISGAYGALAENDPLNPRWAIRALITYDKHLYDRVDAVSRCDRLAFSLSAYNGGLGWVQRRKAASQRPGVCFNQTCDINPGIHPANQLENREYSRRILLELEPRYAAAGFGSGSCGLG
jgi:soluble lytic murein transglycosylase-like protein